VAKKYTGAPSSGTMYGFDKTDQHHVQQRWVDADVQEVRDNWNRWGFQPAYSTREIFHDRRPETPEQRRAKFKVVK